MYHHLQRLSLGFYDTHQIGTLLSTITTDIQTIQGFASSSTLNILVDLLTIVFMLGLMFWMNWDFTLIAVAVTPFLLFFIFRFKKAVKKATHEVRNEQSEIVAVLQQGLESIHVIKAFGRQDLEQEALEAGQPGHRQRRAQGPQDQVAALAPRDRRGRVLHGGCPVARRRADAGATHDRSANSPSTSPTSTKFFKPVKDLATTTNAIAQATVGVDRMHVDPHTDTIIQERPDAVDPESLKGDIAFEHVAFGYGARHSDAQRRFVRYRARSVRGRRRPDRRRQIHRSQSDSSLLRSDERQRQHRWPDVRDYKIKALRAQIGFVLQDTVLFRGTILENIAFGRPERDQRGDHRRGATRQRRRVHRAHAARLRHHGRRTRLNAFRRPAQAHRHRPCDGPQQPDPVARRAHRRARQRIGETRDRGARSG